jgi:hypothetical protein
MVEVGYRFRFFGEDAAAAAAAVLGIVAHPDRNFRARGRSWEVTRVTPRSPRERTTCCSEPGSEET